jgi:hypothetical protein
MLITSSELEDGIAQAVEHRRNFAIISHPDAGKTTLTEKLLLYGGAIVQESAKFGAGVPAPQPLWGSLLNHSFFHRITRSC